MLSTVKVSLSVNELRKIKNIYRNEEHQNHAERYFLSDLKQEIDLQQDDEVEIENIEATLVQNYPPPPPRNNYSDNHLSGCADDIVKFKKEYRKEGHHIFFENKVCKFLPS